MSASSLIIYTVCANNDEAHKIAQAIVGQRLAACANILPPHRSVYWWNGEMQSGEEIVLILKTRTDLFEKAAEVIRAHHSYECPCIISWSIEKGHEPFLHWIKTETRS